MNAPHCPEHHDLIRDLALGRLGDDDALAAESARTSCATCASWWTETFEGPACEALDHWVGDGLAAVALPSRQRQRPWLAAAAAALIMVATGALWNVSQERASVADLDLAPAFATEPAGVIATIDFENGVVPAPDHGALVTVTFENATIELPVVDNNPQLLAAMDFESGDFGEFVPVT